MEVKGTLVKSIKDFVKKRHSEQYKTWFSSLPQSSQSIMNEGIYANNWYPMKEAALFPTKAIAKLFFNNNVKEAAFEAGRFSAETGLKGVYKIFIRKHLQILLFKELAEFLLLIINLLKLLLGKTATINWF